MRTQKPNIQTPIFINKPKSGLAITVSVILHANDLVWYHKGLASIHWFNVNNLVKGSKIHCEATSRRS